MIHHFEPSSVYTTVKADISGDCLRAQLDEQDSTTDESSFVNMPPVRKVTLNIWVASAQIARGSLLSALNTFRADRSRGELHTLCMHKHVRVTVTAAGKR